MDISQQDKAHLGQQQREFGSNTRRRGIDLSEDEGYNGPPAKRHKRNDTVSDGESRRETIVIGDDDEPTFSWKGSGSEIDPITVIEWVTGNLITNKHGSILLSDDDDDALTVGDDHAPVDTVVLSRTPTPSSEDSPPITEEQNLHEERLRLEVSNIESDAGDARSSRASSVTVDFTVRSIVSPPRHAPLSTYGFLHRRPIHTHSGEGASHEDESGHGNANGNRSNTSESDHASANPLHWTDYRPSHKLRIQTEDGPLGYGSSHAGEADDDEDLTTTYQRPKNPAQSEEQEDDENEGSWASTCAQSEKHTSKAISRHSSPFVEDRALLDSSSTELSDDDLDDGEPAEDDDDCVIAFENVKPAHLTSQPWVLSVKEEHGDEEEELPELDWSQFTVDEEGPPDLDSQHSLERQKANEELDRFSHAINSRSKGKIVAELQDDISDGEQESEWNGPLPIELRKRLFYKVYWKAIQPYLKRLLLPFYGSLDPNRKPNECWLYSGPRLDKCKQKGMSIKATFRHRSRPTRLTIHVVFVYKLLKGRLDSEQLEGIIENKWHASHLCGNWTCINERHVHPEPGPVNSTRNGCLPYKDLTCHHRPACLKHLKVDLELLRPPTSA